MSLAKKALEVYEQGNDVLYVARTRKEAEENLRLAGWDGRKRRKKGRRLLRVCPFQYMQGAFAGRGDSYLVLEYSGVLSRDLINFIRFAFEGRIISFEARISEHIPPELWVWMDEFQESGEGLCGWKEGRRIDDFISVSGYLAGLLLLTGYQRQLIGTKEAFVWMSTVQTVLLHGERVVTDEGETLQASVPRMEKRLIIGDDGGMETGSFLSAVGRLGGLLHPSPWPIDDNTRFGVECIGSEIYTEREPG